MAATANGRSRKPYVVSRAERGGEVPLYSAASLDTSLRYRDQKREEDGRPHNVVLYRVTDSDDPERGDADWCSSCGARGAFGADPYCEICEDAE